jgi:hypothetical protein
MYDDLLLPPAEPEIVVPVGPHDVAGIEPAVFHDLGRRLRIIPIAGGLAARINEDAPFFAVARLLSLCLADGEREAGVGQADRAKLVQATRRIVGGDAKLGHAIALMDRLPGQRQEFLLELGGNFVAAGAHESERSEIVRRGAALANEVEQSARQHCKHGRPRCLHERAKLGVIEGPGHRHAGAGRKRAEGERERAEMRAGRRRQHGVGGREFIALGHAREHPPERCEGVGDALSGASAAGGEEDGGWRI